MYKPFTKAQMASKNAEMGNYFFSKNTMRFFNSRVHGQSNKYGLFITSEQATFGIDPQRLYTLRLFQPHTGEVFTVSIFQGFGSIAQARNYRDFITARLDEMTDEQRENFKNLTYATFDEVLGDVAITGPTLKFWIGTNEIREEMNS